MQESEYFEHKGRRFVPSVSYCIVRKVEAGMSSGGIDLSAAKGVNEAKWFLVCASPYWITQAGAKVKHNMHPGDRVYPRPPRKVGENQIGKAVFDAPAAVAFVGMPADHFILALADLMMHEPAGTEGANPTPPAPRERIKLVTPVGDVADENVPEPTSFFADQ